MEDCPGGRQENQYRHQQSTEVLLVAPAWVALSIQPLTETFI